MRAPGASGRGQEQRARARRRQLQATCPSPSLPLQTGWDGIRKAVLHGAGATPAARALLKLYVSRFIADLGAMFRYFGLYSNACSLCICPANDLGTAPTAFKGSNHAWRDEDAARAAVLAVTGGPPLPAGALTCEQLRIKPVYVRQRRVGLRRPSPRYAPLLSSPGFASSARVVGEVHSRVLPHPQRDWAAPPVLLLPSSVAGRAPLRQPWPRKEAPGLVHGQDAP